MYIRQPDLRKLKTDVAAFIKSNQKR